MKVLIVDDSAVMRKIIMRELTALSVTEGDISQAEDGEQAVKAVCEDKYDLILMDWNMPNMLGIDAVKAIRAKGINTPIIMVTTESEKANVIAAIQAGANNYLAKPFTKEDFAAKFSALVGAG
jgi:two-component system chemotaxis response regulator CheY